MVNRNFRRTTYALAYGSNLGDSRLIIDQAKKIIDAHPQIRILADSGAFVTVPVGFESSNLFLNGIWKIESVLHPLELLAWLNRVERHFGRVRLRSGYSDRPIDLDLIISPHLECNFPALQIPHPRFHQRQFVLEPLVHLLPHWYVNSHKASVRELWDDFSKNK